MERSAAMVPVRSIRSLQGMLATPDALRWHAAAFAAGAAALTLLNVTRSPDRLWFWAPLLVWSALLAAHSVFIARSPATFRSARAAVPAAPPVDAVLAVAPAANAPAIAPPPMEPEAPAATTPASAPVRMPAAAELAALRLSLDPWATPALLSPAGAEELPESVLALWRLSPAEPPDEPLPTPPPSTVDLQSLTWI